MKDTVMLQLETAKWALHENLEGLSHEDSLVSAEKGGNNANWVLGHLVSANSDLLQTLGEDVSCDAEQMAPYKRGSEPLDPAKAQPLDELLTAFDRSHDRLVAKLGSMSAQELAAPAPFSPTNNPDETLGSLASVVAFHQAYHVGQTGVLRRMVGRAGAIA